MYPMIQVLGKAQSLYFNGRMFINSLLGLPAQTRKEIQIFKTIFQYFKGNKKIRIFEWGSGFSTIYYADYLKKQGEEFEWHSIDNNREWYEKVKSEVKKKNLQSYVQLYLKSFPPFWKKPGWGAIPPSCGVYGPKSQREKDYISFPRHLGTRFDIVIADARFRRHCIQTAKKVLTMKGLVILHDAQKVHYHVGLDDFLYSRFFFSGSWFPFQKKQNKVWIGSFGNSKIFEILR